MTQDIRVASIQTAAASDVDAVVALDAEITGAAKDAYWSDVFERFAGNKQRLQRYFLVARSAQDQLLGFIVGVVTSRSQLTHLTRWLLLIQ